MISYGVTAREVQMLMQRRSLPAPLRLEVMETVAFLDRCCALGLLHRVSDSGTTLYFPTDALGSVTDWLMQ